ncbi:MAG: hypothetical protein WCR19_06855 [Acholeplasmataceae bacterium]
MKKKKLVVFIVSICILSAFTYFVYNIPIHKDLVEEQSEQIEYGFNRLLSGNDDVQINIYNVEIYIYKDNGYVLFEYIVSTKQYGEYDMYLRVFENPSMHYFETNENLETILPYKEIFDEAIENYDYNYKLTQGEIDDFIRMYK